jgi:hypothetical protein
MLRRDELKKFFITNNVPTQGNFYELIDSGFNQLEDGIQRVSGKSIAIQAAGDNGEVLSFYDTDSSKPAWLINQNPQTDVPAVPVAHKPGLNISDSAGKSRLFIKSDDGSIGIGTVDPAANLHIKGSNVAQVLIGECTKSGHFSGISFNGSLDTPSYNLRSSPSDKNLYLNRPSGSNMQFRVNDADQMCLSAQGNLGIGTVTPGAKLQVVEGAIMPHMSKDEKDVKAGILFPQHPSSEVGESAYIRQYFVTDSKYLPRLPNPVVSIRNAILEISAGNQTRNHIALMTGGNVGIGTNVPDSRLTIVGSGYANDILSMKNSAGVTKWHINMNSGGLNFAESGVADNRVFIKDGGNVGIGTSTPTAKLEVAGAIHAGTSEIYFTNTGHNHSGFGNTFGYAAIENSNDYNTLMILGRSVNQTGPVRRSVNLYDDVFVTGNLVVNNNLSYMGTFGKSDVRIKYKIATIDEAQDMAILNKIKVRDYHLKDTAVDGGLRHKGFIAQEVEKIFPQAVIKSTDFIPDIYSQADSLVVVDNKLTVTMKNPHGLQTGDVVRLITGSGEKIVSVDIVDEKNFSTSNWQENSSAVFVYGKRVDDFRTVNYNAIFALGISAIQLLYKQVQQLKDELAAIKGTETGKVAFA